MAVKHWSRRVADGGVVSWALTVTVRSVTGVVRAGRCGSALFQRDSGDLALRVLTRGRRGSSRPSRTARPMRPVRLGASVTTPAAAVSVSLAAWGARALPAQT